MNYYINGDKVTAEVYDRDRTDNINLGIVFDEVETESTMSMTYDEGE